MLADRKRKSKTLKRKGNEEKHYGSEWMGYKIISGRKKCDHSNDK